MPHLRLSVVIPTRNHAPDLKECLESLQKHARKPFEKIVVDGLSKDDTVKMAKSHGCRVVYDKKGTIGNAYAVGAEAARGDYVVFIDDDAIAPKDLLKKIETILTENPDIDVLGGEDLLKTPATSFQKAAYQTDLATRPKGAVSGDGAWRWLRAACIAYRKTALSNLNFDPRLRGLQEPELHERMRKAGMKALFDPSIFVYHKRRNSFRGLWKQIYRNGLAKIDLLRKHKNMLSFYDLAPFAFILYSFLLLYFGYTQIWAALIAAYFFLKPLTIATKARGLRHFPLLIPITLAREAAYSVGILIGLFATWRRLK